MMKRSAFSAAERDALLALNRDTGFGVLWPQMPGSRVRHPMDVAGVLRGQPETISGGDYDLSPPNDDRPFFFNTSRPLHVVDGRRRMVPLIFGSLMGAVLLASGPLVFDPLRTIEATRPLGERVLVGQCPGRDRLFRRDRRVVHGSRTWAAAAIHHLSWPSDIRPLRGVVFPARVDRGGQPHRDAPTRMGARRISTLVDGAGADDLWCARAARVRGMRGRSWGAWRSRPP